VLMTEDTNSLSRPAAARPGPFTIAIDTRTYASTRGSPFTCCCHVSWRTAPYWTTRIFSSSDAAGDHPNAPAVSRHIVGPGGISFSRMEKSARTRPDSGSTRSRFSGTPGVRSWDCATPTMAGASISASVARTDRSPVRFPGPMTRYAPTMPSAMLPVGLTLPCFPLPTGIQSDQNARRRRSVDIWGPAGPAAQ